VLSRRRMDVQAARRVVTPISDQPGPKKKAMFSVSLPRVLSLLLFFGLSLVSLLTSPSVLGATAPVPPVPWERGSQNSFVTSLCADHQGRVFLGTEDQGLWRFDPAAPTGKQYTHFTTKDGLADDDVYALRKIIRQSFRKGLTNPKSCRILGSAYSYAESTVTFASPGMPFLCSAAFSLLCCLFSALLPFLCSAAFSLLCCLFSALLREQAARIGHRNRRVCKPHEPMLSRLSTASARRR